MWRIEHRGNREVIIMDTRPSSKVRRAEKRIEARQKQISKRFQSFGKCKCCGVLLFQAVIWHLGHAHDCRNCNRRGTSECPYSTEVTELIKRSEPQ